jgi:hypothetical protein
MSVPTIKHPSAFVPVVMSITALALLLGYVAIYGFANDPPHDERAPARIFQLLMVCQALIMAFFAIKWLPQAPRQALQILALQVAAALVPIVLIILVER